MTTIWQPLGIALIIVLIAIFLLMRILRGSRVVPDQPSLWDGRRYACPECGVSMQQGFIMAGRGIIWRRKDDKPISSFAHIGQALDNTLSASLQPRQNMAWHCSACRLILIDHAKLVKR